MDTLFQSDYILYHIYKVEKFYNYEYNKNKLKPLIRIVNNGV